MDRRPTIWHVGGEDVRLRIPLLLALRDRGFDVGAVGSESGEVFADHGIPYWRYSLDRWINPLSDRRTLGELTRLFSREKPALVHGFDTKPGLLVPRAARRAGIFGLRTITGMGYVYSSSSPLAVALRPIYRRAQRGASEAAALTVFQNNDDRRYFVERRLVSEEKSALVRSSGIDVAEFCARIPAEGRLAELRKSLGVQGKVVVTMIGRLVRHKGVMEFLKCAREVRSRNAQVVFLLVGPRASEGRQAVKDSELQAFGDAVLYVGPRADVAALLAMSDVFVLPTFYREGVPRVLLEAGAAGLPLITTDMPGCRDVVANGKNGLLVRPRDVSGLVHAVEQLVASPDRRQAMGAEARRNISEKFSLHSVADNYAALYNKILSARA